MTAIAWDGETLAADKQAVVAGQKYPVTKIARVDGDRLAGISGALGRGLAVVHWLKVGGAPEDFPKSNDDNDYCIVMLVHRSGEVRVYENSPYPIHVDRAFHAIGSGRDFAISVLARGEGAVAAVHEASRFSADCGLGVDSLSFAA